MNFCSHCGAVVNHRVPEGDDRPRFVCDRCERIHYVNPKMVVGCIPEWENKVLLCRRSIEPMYGKWTLPAGYLEKGETVLEGVEREAMEEACADIEIISPYTLFSLPFISQVYLIFRARLLNTKYRAGEESLEVALFAEDDIPWEDLAFLVVKETLKRYFGDRPSGVFPVHTGTISPPKRNRS